MRKLRTTLLAALLLLPGVCFGQVAAVLDLTNTRPGTYFYSVTYGTDGTITIKPIPKVIPVGSDGPSPVITPVTPTPMPYVPPPIVNPMPVPPPAPTPPPQPPPIQTVDQIEQRIQQFTQAALDGGGSVTSAVGMQRAYNIVAGSLETNQLSVDKTFDALKAACDIVLVQTGETAKWTTWRTSVASLIADFQARGVLSTKEDNAALLRHIENGIKNTVNTLGVSDPGLQDRINYEAILKLQKSILDKLKPMKPGAE